MDRIEEIKGKSLNYKQYDPDSPSEAMNRLNEYKEWVDFLLSALAEKEKEIERLNWRLSGKDDEMLDMEGRHIAKITHLKGLLGEAREAMEMLINFIPDKWEMPLGFNQVVAQAKEIIKEIGESR